MINKLRRVPTLKCVSCNTDAVQFEIDEDKVSLAEEVLNDWQKRYRLELERDDVIKLVMRDINNYIELLETKKGKEVNFKGGCFASCPKIIIDENNKIITKYEPKFKANSLAIVSEALAKYLLFDIPIERTITNDDDIRKYQIISHLGSTYEKCVQETNNGYIDLENRNNRIYAGKKPSGLIYKKKANGRLDKLANCPPNPIVDNANKCTINDINKEWYIKLATQWANDFKGIKRLTEYKKQELVEIATNMGLAFDTKIKKDDLIKLIEENKEREIVMVKVTDTVENKIYNVQDITGKRYGHLVVLGLHHVNEYHKSYWICKCDCGNEFVRAKSRIRLSRINTCGKCRFTQFERKPSITHGDSSKNSPNYRLYNIWCGMKKRCLYPGHSYYHRYGGRGIKICDEWLGSNGYMNFKEWALSNGYKDNLTIERKDYDKNYCPENCCWITMLEQHKNTSKVVKISYCGKKYTLHEFCMKFHTGYDTVQKYIIKQGWSAEKYIEYITIKRKEKGNN